MAEAVTIAMAPPLKLVAVRVRADDFSARSALADAWGVALPDRPSRAGVAKSFRVFWIAPDHFWAMADADPGGVDAARLREDLRERHVAVLDITDSRTVFRVRGSGAREILAGGTGVDLHPRAFATGAAALTRFAALHVLLTQVSDEPAFEIVADRATERYLHQFLSEAARA
jgi:sarcosine oxidase, subunit gamma